MHIRVRLCLSIYIYMYDHVCRRIHIGDRLPLTGDITYYLLSGVNRPPYKCRPAEVNYQYTRVYVVNVIIQLMKAT